MFRNLGLNSLSRCVICLALPALVIAFATSAALAAADDVTGPGKKADKPVIVSITFSPQELERYAQNVVKIKVKFRDKGRNLRGGTLELTVTDSAGTSQDIDIDLTGKKYGRAKGKGKEKATITTGDCTWVRIKAWLRDANGNLSRPKVVTLTVKGDDDGDDGDDGPPWGTDLGERAVNFTLYDQDGNSVSLHDYRGSVILVDFSPMWCGPCQEEAAAAEELYQTYKSQGLAILTVLFQDYNRGPVDQAECQLWAILYGITFPVLADTNETVWGWYRDSDIVPLNVIINRQDVITYKAHYYNPEEIEDEVVRLLSQ